MPISNAQTQVTTPASTAAQLEVAQIDLLLKKVDEKKKTEAVVYTETSKEVTTGKGWWRADDAMTISASVLIFGFLVMILMTIVLKRTSIQPEAVLKLFGTTIIVIGALFLIVAGYTQEQMGPAMGLLGTIAGYLLGKNSQPSNTNTSADISTHSKKV